MDPETGSAPPSQRPPWAHWLALALVLLLAASVVLPPLFNISRYKRRIATSISTSIGRPVHMSTVRLHLLPRPGFEITDFEVEEDPAYGDEPMLRSPIVEASIRLSSLWRGRLEIGRISFDEPSLNLVRDINGHWNFDSVLIKASQTEVAPTPQSRPGAALRFPYIEGTNARINFKQGYEKLPLSFLNSDVAVWLDKPEEWRLRVEAQPVRTDLDLALSDTGLLRVDGTFHRAPDLQQIPMVLHAEWSKAPLGQLNRLLAHNDMGWRGDLDVQADITGTAANANIKARIRAEGVHRLEFAPLEPLDMDATCQGNYLAATTSLQDLACVSPVGNGKLMIAGAVHTLAAQPQPDLKLHMEKVPVSVVLESLRSVRYDFAPSLGVRGSLDGDFTLAPQDGFPTALLTGAATVSALEITSPELERPLTIPEVKLITTDGRPIEAPAPAHHAAHKPAKPAVPPAVSEPALLMQPVSLTGSGPNPIIADGQFTRDHFSVHLAGSASVKDLATIARAFGFLKAAVAPLALQGTAELNLTVRGPWLLPLIQAPVSPDSAEGTLQVKNARIAPAFLPLPVDITSAAATFTLDQVAWQPIAFTYAGLEGEAALRYAIPCPAEKGCNPHFDLRFTTLDAAAAEAALLGGSAHQGTLKDLLSRLNTNSRPWPTMSGTISAATLKLEDLAIHEAHASITIDGPQVALQSLEGQALGGQLHAAGTVDLSGNRPHYVLDLETTKTSAADIAELFKEKWGSGPIALTTHLDLTGYTQDELLSSAHGTFKWDWTKGAFATEAPTLARFDRWQAEGTIADKALTLANSTITQAKAVTPVTGTISFDRELNLTIGTSPTATQLTGTPLKPHQTQSQLPNTEAQTQPPTPTPPKRSTRTSP